MKQEKTAVVRVTIGLPVYNGEKHLAEVIDAILAQTFEDFELVISDNASTDRTAAICRDYQARDPRIVYYRQPVNRGAAPNFNFTFEKARGEYFKWAASDDVIAPTFLQKCVQALDADPAASLCAPWTSMIDDIGATVGSYSGNPRYGSEDLGVRFRELLKMHGCYEVFGLIRASALRQTRLIVGTYHGDGILLAHLGLLGRFAVVPEYLFFSRKHPGQSINMSGNRFRYAAWFDARNTDRFMMPYWRIFREYTRVMRETPMNIGTRAACMRSILGYAWTKRRALKGDMKVAARRIRDRYVPSYHRT